MLFEIPQLRCFSRAITPLERDQTQHGKKYPWKNSSGSQNDGRPMDLRLPQKDASGG
jgi:hypothetical protein